MNYLDIAKAERAKIEAFNDSARREKYWKKSLPELESLLAELRAKSPIPDKKTRDHIDDVLWAVYAIQQEQRKAATGRYTDPTAKKSLAQGKFW